MLAGAEKAARAAAGALIAASLAGGAAWAESHASGVADGDVVPASSAEATTQAPRVDTPGGGAANPDAALAELATIVDAMRAALPAAEGEGAESSEATDGQGAALGPLIERARAVAASVPPVSDPQVTTDAHDRLARFRRALDEPWADRAARAEGDPGEASEGSGPAAIRAGIAGLAAILEDDTSP